MGQLLRYGLVLTLIIIGLSFVGYVIEDVSPQHLATFEASVIILGVTFISTYLVDVLFRIAELQKGLLQIKDIVDEKKIIEPVLDKMRPLHEFIREIGEGIIAAQIESIKIMGNGFVIPGKDWAMRANKLFWKDLQSIASEEKRKGNSLVCYVVHSSDPRIWKEAESIESLKEQRELIARGGRIERIIVGKEPAEKIINAIQSVGRQDEATFFKHAIRPHQFLDGKPSLEDYADAIILMTMYNIDVYYHGSNEHYSDDFASVFLDGKELVMRWSYTQRLGRVESCLFEESAGESKNSWDRLRIHAEPMNVFITTLKNAP